MYRSAKPQCRVTTLSTIGQLMSLSLCIELDYLTFPVIQLKQLNVEYETLGKIMKKVLCSQSKLLTVKYSPVNAVIITDADVF
jgi:hypothetical protein